MFAFLIALSLQPSFANLPSISIGEVTSLQSNISKTFHSSIERLGFLGFQIVVSEEMPTYVGGVQLKNQTIIITVGSDALKQYSKESFRFMICHELGHHLGGAPYKQGPQYVNTKVSTEGQSDYWAASTCLPKLSEDPIRDAEKFFRKMNELLQPLPTENHFYAIPKKGVIDTRFYDSEYMSFQCRLNTIEAGVNQRPRPSCWYKK